MIRPRPAAAGRDAIMLRRSTLALISTLAVGLAACDADTTDAEGAPPPEGVDAFAAQADEICATTRTQLHQERVELFDADPLLAEDAQQSFERAGGMLASEVEQLRNLEAPAESAPEVEGWLASIEEASIAYQRAGESAEAAAALAGGEDPLARAEETADGLGMRFCGTETQVDQDLDR